MISTWGRWKGYVRKYQWDVGPKQNTVKCLSPSPLSENIYIEEIRWRPPMETPEPLNEWMSKRMNEWVSRWRKDWMNEGVTHNISA